MADQKPTTGNQETEENQKSSAPEAKYQIEPEAAVMSGFAANELGLNAKTPENLAEIEPAQPSEPDPQDLRNYVEAQDDRFTGNSKDADTFAYNIAMQGIEGLIAGKSFGSDEESSHKKEEEKNNLLRLLEETKTLQQLWQDFEELSNKVDDTIVAYEGLSQELNDSFLKIQATSHEAAERFVKETQKLQALQEQLKQAQEQNDTVRIEALQKDVERQEILVNSQRAAYEAQAKILGEVSDEGKKIRQEIQDLKDTRDELKIELDNADTEEKRAAIQEKMEAANRSLEQKNIEIQQVEDRLRAAETTSTKMIELGEDGNYSSSDISTLMATVGNNAELKSVVTTLMAATTAKGISVTTQNGNVLTGQSASDYFNAEMEVGSIDSKRYEIEKQLKLTPDDSGLTDEMASLDARRLEMENKAGMCFMDLAQDQRIADIKELSEYDTLSNAAAELKNATIDTAKIEGYLVFEENGQYTLKNATESYNVADMPVNEQADILAQIQAQLDQGKQIASPDAAAKLAAVQTASADFIAAAKEIADSNGDTASSIVSEETQKAMETQSDQTTANNFNVPNHHLDEADAARRAVLATADAAISSGQAVTQEQIEKLSQLAGMSPDKVTNLLRENNAEVEEPNLIAGTVPQVFGGTGTYQLVKAATLATIAPTLLLGAGNPVEYPSFVESEQFRATNPPDQEVAAMASYNTGIKSNIDVSGIYAAKVSPVTSQTTTLEQQQRDLEQRLMEDRLRQQQQALMASQIGIPMPPTSSGGMPGSGQVT